MTATEKGAKSVDRVDRVVTKERLLGTESRWRRFGEPTPAGGSLKEDGTPDYGVFGPGSIAWDVLLHPATIFFQSPAQFVLQLTYKPVLAGVRDWDPISRKARKGELTIFDNFDRQQRNSGIHTPMWLGDTATAHRVAKHLRNIHTKVAGDVIDIAHPELGGYDANGPRDAMWAALTEMHTMLWVYENLAFRDGKPPHRLAPAQRDQYIAEVAEYCRLFDSPEGEIPTTMAELKALYEKYDQLFKPSWTMDVIPATGQSFHKVTTESIKKNFHVSQLRIHAQLLLSQKLFHYPILGAVSGKTRRNMGVGPLKSKMAVASTKAMLPLIWLAQQSAAEQRMTRIMWGPDAVKLIESARDLHRQAKAGLLAGAPYRARA
ncbi:oxygenase MpaB family protein [Streptacidiphilus carbonis]|uniref:oxygenase MpaB family protein n=1 Tax=Streptacidiphilus carbonis TaxID=105422 RepID=UPI0005A6FED3|nr:oxygenase MpaB family protein [Streptacidiphilus carbonis]